MRTVLFAVGYLAAMTVAFILLSLLIHGEVNW